MKVRVEYYGVLRSLAGTREEFVEVAAPATVAAVVAAVAARHHGIDGAMRGVATAVDEQLTGRGTPVVEGQVVALLPPVSGG